MARRNLWWSEMTGPSRFINAAVELLQKERSVLFGMPKTVPFEDDFFNILQEELKENFTESGVVFLDGNIEDVSGYFMERYCRAGVQASFRPKPGYSAARFLAENENASLHGNIFVVIPESTAVLSAFENFVSDYSKHLRKDIDPALFVITAKESWLKANSAAGIKQLHYADYATTFDAYTYCALRASEIKEPDAVKAYLAELASTVTKGNVEQAEVALSVYREFLNSPQLFFEKRGVDIPYDDDRLECVIWEAQLKCLFPLLERFRRYLVEKYTTVIQRNLPLRNPLGDDYTEASDVELGAMLYMIKCRMFRIEYDDFQELKVCASARNDLAHVTVLPYETIRRITSY